MKFEYDGGIVTDEHPDSPLPSFLFAWPAGQDEPSWEYGAHQVFGGMWEVHLPAPWRSQLGMYVIVTQAVMAANLLALTEFNA